MYIYLHNNGSLKLRCLSIFTASSLFILNDTPNVKCFCTLSKESILLFPSQTNCCIALCWWVYPPSAPQWCCKAWSLMWFWQEEEGGAVKELSLSPSSSLQVTTLWCGYSAHSSHFCSLLLFFFCFWTWGWGADSTPQASRHASTVERPWEQKAQRSGTSPRARRRRMLQRPREAVSSTARYVMPLWVFFFSSFKPHFKSSLFLKPMSGMCLLELWRSFIIYFFAESCWWRTDKNRFRTQQVSGAAPIFKLFAVCEINVPS